MRSLFDPPDPLVDAAKRDAADAAPAAPGEPAATRGDAADRHHTSEVTPAPSVEPAMSAAPPKRPAERPGLTQEQQRIAKITRKGSCE